MKRLLLVVLLCGCPDEKKAVIAAAPVPDAAVAAPVPDAAVEFFGTIDPGKLKPARIVFLVTRGPCEEKSEELDVIEQQDVNPGKLFTEMFFPQGTVGHLCAVALDAKGKLIGFAAFAKNPVTFEGQGEVEVRDVDLKLTGVKARAAPKGM
jgi:hypothetical protein